MKKNSNDIRRGATNCNVLQEGNDPSDHAHVKKQTPMQTKRAEIMSDPMYRTDLNDGLNTERQRATTRARREGNVRPLGGGNAKKG
jgi:hypothetical protein